MRDAITSTSTRSAGSRESARKWWAQARGKPVGHATRGAVVCGFVASALLHGHTNAEMRIATEAPAAARSGLFQEHWLARGPHRIYAREYPGSEPAIVLMHGFPDDLGLYDRLVPYLRGRHLVLFDFLGWGRSEKPTEYPYTFANLLGDLDAVLNQLELRKPILVAHDASGPPAIDWALDHPDGVAALVLLNTFYDLTPSLLPPEAIAIFADLLELKTAALPGQRASFSFICRPPSKLASAHGTGIVASQKLPVITSRASMPSVSS